MNQTPYQATSHQPLHGNYSNASNRPSAGGREMLDSHPAGSASVSVVSRDATEARPALGEAAPTSSAGSPSSGRDSSGRETTSKLAQELNQFTMVASQLRRALVPAPTFNERCQQAFDVANDLFSNAPTWVCFYRELMGGSGMLHTLFNSNKDFGAFLRTDQHHQIQLMLTALRSRDLPENDPNDPQRMITVRLPKSLHEAMCEEAGRLNISVNRLCISRMLQLLDPEMIPETNSKPRGRKPRTRSKPATTAPVASTAPAASAQSTSGIIDQS